MRLDLLFDPFGGDWDGLRSGAQAAERAGFDGLWLYDHLAGSVHGARHVLECWTTLSALAAAVPRLAIGPLVLNVANRDPGTLAVMAATLQSISGGRLLLGLGAGGGRETPYASEQVALGREVHGDAERRDAVARAVTMLRRIWTGDVGPASGFLVPDPAPPILLGGFGPKMAELAGRLGDGINAPGGRDLPRLMQVAREAHARAGRDPARFVVTASAGGSARQLGALRDLGVDRAILSVGVPYVDGVEALRELVDAERLS